MSDVNHSPSIDYTTIPQVPEISFLVDAQGIIRFTTPEVAHYLGSKPATVCGQSVFDFVSAGDEAAAREWWQAFAQGTDLSTETHLAALFPGGYHARTRVSGWRLPDDDRFLFTQHLTDHLRDRLETLYSILLTVSGTLELDEVLDIVLEEAKRLIPSGNASLFMMDQNAMLRLAQGRTTHPEITPALSRAFADFETTRILRETGRPLLINDCAADPRWQAHPDSPDIRSWLGAPLVHRGTFLGALSIDSPQPDHFTPEDAQLAQALAGQAALALYNAHAYEGQQRRAQQFEAISNVSLALGHMDLNGLLDVVYQQVSGLMDTSTFFIGLYNPEMGMLRITGAYDHGFQRADEMQAADEGMAGAVLRTREPIAILDTDQEPLPQEAILDGEVPRSILMMPLIAQDEILGVISVQSYRSNAYTADDITLLETLAGPVASAIQNVQLFDETANRLAMLEAIHHLGLALAAGHDIDGIAKLIIEAAFDLFRPNEAWLYLLEDPAWPSARWTGRPGAAPGEIQVDHGEAIPPAGPLEHALRATQPIISAPATSAAEQQCFNTNWMVRTTAACPIRYGGQLLGALALLYDQPHEFVSDTLRALELVSIQAATAFDNARYHITLRHRLDEASALHELAQRVSSSQSLDDILRTVVRTVQQVFQCHSVSIGLLDEAEQTVIVRASIGIDPRLLPQARFRLGEPVAGRVVSTGSIIYVPDTYAARDFRFIDPAIRSLLSVPLTVQDRAIGALSIDSEQPFAFTPDHERLLTIAGGQIAAAIQTMHLLDQARERAAQLAEANASLKELDELRDELIANVSHELRSPLALVRGYAGLLRAEEMGSINDEQAEVLGIIDDKVQSISRLIDDILALERISHDTLELSVVDLNELCQKAIDGAALVYADRNLHFEAVLTPGSYMMEGDRDRLNQVLDNLLGNAAKFSPEDGTVTLRTSVDPPGTRFAISITDQGIGIPADKLPHIFERFFQADHSIKHRFGGSGLGLSIVQRITEAHGGEVHVESQEGQGSTFTVVLPLEPVQDHGAV